MINYLCSDYFGSWEYQRYQKHSLPVGILRIINEIRPILLTKSE